MNDQPTSAGIIRWLNDSSERGMRGRMTDERWPDAEKIPPERFDEVFRPPPGAPNTFRRSAMIVGSRGAGKTTLLLSQRRKHEGACITLDLMNELAPIAKETHRGPIEVELSASLEPLIEAKAAAVLAAAIAEQASALGMPYRPEALLRCLPVELHGLAAGGPARLKEALAQAPAREFGSLVATKPLPDFVEAVAEAAMATHGPLMVQVDRAETVAPSALAPALHLLDQSAHYVTLLAIRPGALRGDALPPGTAIPGDHYSVVQLGRDPRGADWTKFILEATPGLDVPAVPGDVRNLILWLARDSVRNALELTEGFHLNRDDFVAFVRDFRNLQMSQAQAMVQASGASLTDLVREVRTRAIREFGEIRPPIVLELRGGDATLFGRTRADRFVDMGLRQGALAMPEGAAWHPGLRLEEVEIPPLLVWQKDLSDWGPLDAAEQRIQLRRGDIVDKGGAPRQERPVRLFIAYRMTSKPSSSLRHDLETRLKRDSRFRRLYVTDGVTPGGTEWPNEIRKRISKSNVVVADATGPRMDVMYEVGLSWGYGKRVIPVIESSVAVPLLPHFVTRTQYIDYGATDGLDQIARAIDEHARDPDLAKVEPAPRVVPRIMTWWRPPSWAPQLIDQANAFVSREGFGQIEVHDVNVGERTDVQLAKKVGRAGVIVFVVDGTQLDAFAHVVAGSACAVPDAGGGVGKLPRRVLVMSAPGSPATVAESLLRMEDVVRLVDERTLFEELRSYIEAYQEWTNH